MKLVKIERWANTIHFIISWSMVDGESWEHQKILQNEWNDNKNLKIKVCQQILAIWCDGWERDQKNILNKNTFKVPSFKFRALQVFWLFTPIYICEKCFVRCVPWIWMILSLFSMLRQRQWRKRWQQHHRRCVMIEACWVLMRKSTRLGATQKNFFLRFQKMDLQAALKLVTHSASWIMRATKKNEIKFHSKLNVTKWVERTNEKHKLATENTQLIKTNAQNEEWILQGH